MSPVSVLGGVGHYLSLLIMSNYWYDYGRSTHYTAHNIGMVASLCLSQAFGRIYGLVGLANTSTVFTVLYMLEKVPEVRRALGFAAPNGWFVVFGGSIAAYYTALWLHANPAFLMSLFTSMEVKDKALEV